MIENVFHQFYQDVTSLPILMRGLQAAILVSIVCSTLSVFVVLKRLAFIGEGIAHSALGGIALGVMFFVSGPMLQQSVGRQLGIDLTTMIFCIIIAWLIGWTSRKRIISEDTAIGIFFVASLAFGIVLISLRKEYTAELFSFLFGSVLAVGTFDIYLTIALAVLVLSAVIFFFRPMFLFCLDEELAGVSGIPVGPIHYMLLTLLAVTVVVAIKILGVLLVAAFLVIPGATARMLTYRYKHMFLISNLIGIVAVIGGLFLSDVVSDLPSGPAIVLGEFAIFILAMTWSHFREKLFPGRSLTAVGAFVTLAGYIAIFLTICALSTAGPTSAQQAKSTATKATAIDQPDWTFFIEALENRKYDSLVDRIDRDAEFVEMLSRRIKSLPISDDDKQQLLNAIDTMDWTSVSKDLVVKIKQGR
jgi:ABC-type Mn2+/Zn2+ transport system permease subunit